MNTNTAGRATGANDIAYTLLYPGTQVNYQLPGNVGNQGKPGMTRDGKDIADLTKNGNGHVTVYVDQAAQPADNPYQIKLTQRAMVVITDGEKNDKRTEIGSTYALSWIDNQIVGWGFCNPKKAAFWIWIVLTVIFVVIPIILLASFATLDPSKNAAIAITSGLWLALGTGALTGITCYCYQREDVPAMETKRFDRNFAQKRGAIYEMYLRNNDSRAKDTSNYFTSQDKRASYQRQIKEWFANYRTKIEGAGLTNEDNSVFLQLLSSHEIIFSNLFVDLTGSWVTNEKIMADNLKQLFLSKDEKCRQLAENWVDSFVKFADRL